MGMNHWSTAEIRAELMDADESLASLLEQASKRAAELTDARVRSTAVYGADPRRWPASSSHHHKTIEGVIQDIERATVNTEEYRQELLKELSQRPM